MQFGVTVLWDWSRTTTSDTWLEVTCNSCLRPCALRFATPRPINLAWESTWRWHLPSPDGFQTRTTLWWGPLPFAHMQVPPTRRSLYRPDKVVRRYLWHTPCSLGTWSSAFVKLVWTTQSIRATASDVGAPHSHIAWVLTLCSSSVWATGKPMLTWGMWCITPPRAWSACPEPSQQLAPSTSDRDRLWFGQPRLGRLADRLGVSPLAADSE